MQDRSPGTSGHMAMDVPNSGSEPATDSGQGTDDQGTMVRGTTALSLLKAQVRLPLFLQQIQSNAIQHIALASLLLHGQLFLGGTQLLFKGDCIWVIEHISTSLHCTVPTSRLNFPSLRRVDAI